MGDIGVLQTPPPLGRRTKGFLEQDDASAARNVVEDAQKEEDDYDYAGSTDFDYYLDEDPGAVNEDLLPSNSNSADDLFETPDSEEERKRPAQIPSRSLPSRVSFTEPNHRPKGEMEQRIDDVSLLRKADMDHQHKPLSEGVAGTKKTQTSSDHLADGLEEDAKVFLSSPKEEKEEEAEEEAEKEKEEEAEEEEQEEETKEENEE